MSSLHPAEGERMTAFRTSANKYGAVDCELDGYKFSSRHEMKRYAELRLREKAGEIRSLHLQPAFELQEAFVDSSGRKQRSITYTADFSHVDCKTGKTVITEAKGFKARDYPLRKKLFLFKFREYIFEEV